MSESVSMDFQPIGKCEVECERTCENLPCPPSPAHSHFSHTSAHTQNAVKPREKCEKSVSGECERDGECEAECERGPPPLPAPPPVPHSRSHFSHTPAHTRMPAHTQTHTHTSAHTKPHTNNILRPSQGLQGLCLIMVGPFASGATL